VRLVFLSQVAEASPSVHTVTEVDSWSEE